MTPPDVLIAIPVKPFGVAKRRLAPALNAAQRSQVGRAVAAHVIATASATGCRVAVVTGDEGVASWALRKSASVIREPAGGGLDRAATAAVRAARSDGHAWMILHADLPALTKSELEEAVARLPEDGVLLAPSHDGGTSLVGADLDSFSFAYGPASFRRHLGAVARLPHRLLVRPGFALDLDGPADLATAVRLPAGGWLAELIPSDAGLAEPSTR
jgi:2-phospho-L-lactate guanylyltransferase